MKIGLRIVLSLMVTLSLLTPAFAADSTEDSSKLNMATTKTEYKLERENIANTSSTTVEIDMNEEPATDRLVVDEDIAFVQTGIMIFNENQISTEVFLTSYDGVFFTKVEGTARLYVNGKYVASEDFEADPLIPVHALQAATLIDYPDGFKVGDNVTVFFDGSFDTASHGSRDIYQSSSLKVTEL